MNPFWPGWGREREEVKGREKRERAGESFNCFDLPDVSRKPRRAIFRRICAANFRSASKTSDTDFARASARYSDEYSRWEFFV